MNKPHVDEHHDEHACVDSAVCVCVSLYLHVYMRMSAVLSVSEVNMQNLLSFFRYYS